MKKLVLVTLVCVLSSFKYAGSQAVKETLVSGKWFVESVQEKGEEPEKSADKEDEWLVFHKDGKIEKSYFGEIYTSTWKYSEEEKTIRMEGEEGTLFLKIIEISSEKLIVELLDGSVDSGTSNSKTSIVTYVK